MSFKKLLSVLLASGMSLSPVALMEGAVWADADSVAAEVFVDAVDETVGEEVSDFDGLPEYGFEDEGIVFGSEYDSSGELISLMEANKGEISIDDSFPDPDFREYVKEEIDEDGNGMLSVTERKKVTDIEIGEKDVSDLTGIDLFPKLEYLECIGNKLTTIDVSKNTALKYLWCNDNQLTTIDVSKNTALITLGCSNCQITTLDVSKNPALEYLYCDDNQLTIIDVSKNTDLEGLDCSNCQITTLDVSINTDLRVLYCSDNKLTSLDVSKCRELRKLVCGSNQLITLDVNKNTALEYLYCSDNKLTSLVVNKCKELTGLNCEKNQLTTLDISNCSLTQYVKKECYRINNGIVYYDGFYNYGDYWDWDEDYHRSGTVLSLDANVKIIGGNPVSIVDTPSTDTTTPATDTTTPATGTPATETPATDTLVPTTDTPATETPTSTTDTTPASEPVIPTISAVKKSSKMTVTAAPGTIYQLDLDGATGKKFKSSNKKVATVKGTGLVTVKGAGKTKITFKVGKKTRTVTLTVKDSTMPKSIKLDQSGTVATKVGDKVTLTATLNEGAKSAIQWTTSDKKVATVRNGVVTFKKAGKVTITATTKRGNKKAKVKFKVSK